MRKRFHLSEQYFRSLCCIDCVVRFIQPLLLVLFCLLFFSLEHFVYADEIDTQSNSILKSSQVSDASFADYSKYEDVDGSLSLVHYKILIDADVLNSKYSYVNWTIQQSGLKVGLPVSDICIGYSSNSSALVKM